MGLGRLVAAVVLVATAVVVLDAAMLARVVPAARAAGWPEIAPLALIAAVDGLIGTLARDLWALPGLPEGSRLVPLFSIWRRACWLAALLLASLLLVRAPAVFDLR